MTINTVLYIDDSFENGMTAMSADSRIDYASGLSQVEKPFQDYDCVITDMKMEHAESGMEVVDRALREGRLPYVATGGTYEHGGTFNRVKLFDANNVKMFNQVTKADERFWKEALAYIERIKNPNREALEKVKATIGSVPEATVRMLMNFYKTNNNFEK